MKGLTQDITSELAIHCCQHTLFFLCVLLYSLGGRWTRDQLTLPIVFTESSSQHVLFDNIPPLFKIRKQFRAQAKRQKLFGG